MTDDVVYTTVAIIRYHQVRQHDLVSTLLRLAFPWVKQYIIINSVIYSMELVEKKKNELVNSDLDMNVQPLVVNALLQLKELWQTFGLSEQEQLQQKRLMLEIVEKSCQDRVSMWHNEVDRATMRVTELEKEVQTIKAQFQGNNSAGWCMQSLDQLSGSALRDKVARLEMEFKFLDSIRTSRLNEVNKLQDQLMTLDKKLGSTSVLPSGVSKLSEEFKAALQELVANKSREIHIRRAALLEAVSECVQLAQELQIEPDHTFEADVNARLKKRDLSTEMLQKISLRTVELREVKLKQEARLAEMLGKIHNLWRQLKISKEEQERFQMTIHGIGKAALASCEAELKRLQRYCKRYAAIAVQVENLRNAITKHWDLLGYNSDQRAPFNAMMTTPDTELSFRIFRAHEKEFERLKRQMSAMKFLTHYVSKREEILQARAQHGVPDKQTRLHIEQDLPRYTAILLNRIGKWEKETGLVFCWKGEPYLEQMRLADHKFEKQRNKTKQVQPQQTLAQQTQHVTVASSSGFNINQRRRIQRNTRHSIEERAPSRFSTTEEQFQPRRSDSQVHERPRWRKFFRSTFSRHENS
ncbi:unnamed protein product [Peronospora belbahrii]|uniref:Uncharacterized protein n=1 Tax=Peronospora belbahrii TaxID=622444 RepID=A0AAU9KTW7_9STRA|nr:unnamed protein product [Peronospora belbahrii]CAH0520310.1 unnamed protein product [Peronospora belbahrii]